MTKQKKLILFSFLFLFYTGSAISQGNNTNKNVQKNEDLRYPNVIKINTLAIPFNNISLSYERGIKPGWSAGLGVGYKYTGAEPKLFSVGGSNIAADIDKITGFSITPDARYYIRSCDPGLLDGFYAGLYIRYTGYSSDVNFTYIPSDSPVEIYSSNIAMNEYGVGIQLGYQLMMWERFSLDFLFFGPRFSSYHLTYEFDQAPSREFLDDLSEHINEVIDRFGFDYTVEVEQKGETKANTTFSFANVRFGISLGIAF